MERTENPLDALIDAMLQSHGRLALELEHLLRAGACAGLDAEPVPDVMRRRLRAALAPLAERRGDLDVAVTAEVLAAATEAIGPPP